MTVKQSAAPADHQEQDSDGPISGLNVETDLGNFAFTLNTRLAPYTCAYFHDLAASGTLDNSAIFRIVSPKNTIGLNASTDIEVVQIGTRHAMDQQRDAVVHEPTNTTGLRHRQWTVSAARFEVGELYQSFFICMRDEPSLDFGGERSPDGRGFAAFGEVVSGFDTLLRAFSLAEDNELLSQNISVHRVTPMK
ncbi:MAG: peptidylprolyl isomerase [Lysobacterales bacterium]